MTSCCSRTSGSTRARPPRPTTERAEFADALAGLADAYVSDGFGVVHRKQASVYDVATRLPSAMGGLVLTEVEVLKRLTETPERPYAVVLGGAKVADKLAVIDNLMETADRLLIGGGMLFTFLAAQGHEIGTSLFDADSVDAVQGLPQRAEDSGVEIVLPVDVVCGREFSADAETVTVAADAIPADRMGLDIGPRVGRSSTPRSSPTPARSSGTARWARSRWSRSPRAPAGSPRPSSR